MILVYGTVCLDRVLHVPNIPPAGGYVGITTEEWRLGGEGANTAFALKTWGANCLLMGNHVGNGEEIEFDSPELRLLEVLLDDKHLADYPLRKVKPPVCDIYVTPDGERTMFGLGFDSMSEGLEFRDEWLDGVDWFSIDMNFNAFGRTCVEQAAARGVRCYLMDYVHADDPIPPSSVWQTSTDWAGSKTLPKVNLDLVEQVANERGVTAVLTDGAQGCYYCAPEAKPGHRPPIAVPKVVDATGAGDTFRAGMLYGLDLGWQLEKCLDFALVAGSLKCQYPGATTQQASLAEIEAHL